MVTAGRALYLVGLATFLAVAVVGLRVEQIRTAAAVGRMQRERVALRREAWSLQMEIGRLSAPARIRECVARWSMNLMGPGSNEAPGPETRWASVEP